MAEDRVARPNLKGYIGHVYTEQPGRIIVMIACRVGLNVCALNISAELVQGLDVERESPTSAGQCRSAIQSVAPECS